MEAGVFPSGPYPEREGEPDCSYYVRTGVCRFGSTCRFNHPPNRKLAIATAIMKGEYPERPGQPECQACIYPPLLYMNGNAAGQFLPENWHLQVWSYVQVSSSIRHGWNCWESSFKYFRISASPGTNWSLTRASIIPSQRWQGPFTYTSVILPHGVVPVPGWDSYMGQIGSVPSSNSQQQTAGNSSMYGTSHLTESTESQGTYPAYHSGSVPAGYYALQRDNAFPERPKTTRVPRLGLPLRPGEPLCLFYSRCGTCKFGPNCQFDHPMGVVAYNLSPAATDASNVHRYLGSSSASGG